MILSEYVNIYPIHLVDKKYWIICYDYVDHDLETNRKIYELLYNRKYLEEKYHNQRMWEGDYLFKTIEDAQEALDWLDARILADEILGKYV